MMTTNNSNEESILLLFLTHIQMMTTLLSSNLLYLEEDEVCERELTVAQNGKNKKRLSQASEGGRMVKRKKYDWDGARKCIQRDYLGNDPLFNETQFRRMFRISRFTFNKLKVICQQSDLFCR